jgi:inhibitor of cysteine peptidase
MKMTVAIVACILLCVLNACSAQKSAYEQLQGLDLPVVGTFTDPSRTIRVNPGDKFVIVLDSNATTGYSWQAPDRTSCVSLNAHRYEAPQSPMTGAGGKEHFEFTARSVGKESLSFHYARPWEKDAPPVNIKTFTVEVLQKKGDRQ